MVTIEIHGERGEGKTTLAELIAKFLCDRGCEVMVDDVNDPHVLEKFRAYLRRGKYDSIVLSGKVVIRTRHTPSARD